MHDNQDYRRISAHSRFNPLLALLAAPEVVPAAGLPLAVLTPPWSLGPVVLLGAGAEVMPPPPINPLPSAAGI
jgi:hypothetical protein